MTRFFDVETDGIEAKRSRTRKPRDLRPVEGSAKIDSFDQIARRKSGKDLGYIIEWMLTGRVAPTAACRMTHPEYAT
jgi:hypothetical protein